MDLNRVILYSCGGHLLQRGRGCFVVDRRVAASISRRIEIEDRSMHLNRVRVASCLGMKAASAVAGDGVAVGGVASYVST